jgi:hypothetical protein
LSTITPGALAELLMQTGHAHHRAYIDANGIDPEWALWYAPYLETRLEEGFGRHVGRSELVYLLIRSQREHEAGTADEPWPRFYAGLMLEIVSAGDVSSEDDA